MNSKKKPAFGRTLTIGVLTRFVVTCVLFTLASIVMLFFGMFVCYLIPWNGGLIYELLIMVRDNVVFFMGLFLVAGYIIIFLIYWGKTLGYLGDVVRATEQIYKGGDGPVILPAALHDIEAQMNQIKSDMLASRRAAEDADRRKNDLVVYLAHDLKTPLTSVIGYLTLLQDEQELTTEQRAKYTGIALDKAERLEDLINEFFDITRFSLTSVTLDRRSVNLSRMLEQIADEFAPMLRERGLSCAVNAPSELMISCDPDKLQRVFCVIFLVSITLSGNIGNAEMHKHRVMAEHFAECLCLFDTGHHPQRMAEHIAVGIGREGIDAVLVLFCHQIKERPDIRFMHKIALNGTLRNLTLAVRSS